MSEERLRQVLEATLSPDKTIRQAGETELRNLSSEPGIASSFLTSALGDGPYPIAQAAAVALKQYLATHWSEAAEKFEPPSVPQELRPRIRQALLEGISNRSKGISRSCAHSVAIIARYDWPDYWPNLMDDLISMLRQGSTDQLEGAMEVVTEMVREEFGPDQLPTIASSLLPTLLDILRNESIEWMTRGKTLDNFQEILSVFTTIREEHPQAVKQAMEHFGPLWLAEMDNIVSRDLDADFKRDPGLLPLRGHCFKVFHALDKDFAKFFAPYRTHLVQIAVQNLTGLIPGYQKYCISTSPDVEGLDDYDEILIFDGIINDTFDFLTRAARHPSLKKLFIQVSDDQELGSEFLQRLLGSVAPIVQMPSASIQDYHEDVNLFLEEDDEEMGSFSIRSAGYDLVGSLFDQYPRAVAAILQSILITKVHETIAARQAGHKDWWQPLEAMLAMLISLSDDISFILEEDQSAGRAPTIALGQLYSEVVASILSDAWNEESEIIQPRSLLYAAAFAALLPKEDVEAAFNIAIEVLENPDVRELSKMSAIKAIKNFCRHVSPEMVQPRSQHIMSILLPNMRDLKDEMLYLVMETLRAILGLDKNALNPDSVRVMAELVFQTWLQNSTDPVATAIVEELLEVVAGGSAPPVVLSLVIALAPRLAATIVSPVTSANEHLPAEAVQLANSLIRTRGGPIEGELVSTITAAVMDCLAKTDDMHVVQHGIVHLTQIVRKDCGKLLQWRSPSGVSGMDSILQLLSKFLSPEFPETGGIYVGDLIIHLLRKASSEIGPILPSLLQALVIRLATAKLESFIEALVLPFAYLFGTEHTQATLDLLGSLPTPDPTVASSALQLVLQKWCELSDEISGSWNIRVNALGLARLYANPSPALRDTPVRGDLIINDANRDVIITRSKARANPAQYTPSPFNVKCLKLILKELQTYKTTAGGKGKKVSNDTIDLEEDDGDAEWDDEDDGLGVPEGKGEFDFLSSWLDDAGGDNEAQDDDEDLKSDPIAQIDMVDHLTNVLRHCYTTNENGMHEHISGLNEVEKGTLRGVLTM